MLYRRSSSPSYVAIFSVWCIIHSWVHPMWHAGHPGIIYHYLNDKNWEGFYFRPHSTGTTSAIQFTCHVNGKGTYPAGNAVKVPTDGSWFNAEVIVTESKATLVMKGLKWTVNRCTKNLAGGVGIFK